MADTIRSRMVELGRWYVEHEPQVHYAQTRPIPLAAFKSRHLPLTTDCSGFVTGLAYAAGAPDPNGLGYTGAGFTGTLLDQLDVINAGQAQVGDFVVFGQRPGAHVVIISRMAPAVMCISHGQEKGPIELSLSSEISWHRQHGNAEVTYLRSVPADVAPPRPRWEVRNGRGELLRTVYHPALFAARHPRMFRKWQNITFHRRAD